MPYEVGFLSGYDLFLNLYHKINFNYLKYYDNISRNYIGQDPVTKLQDPDHIFILSLGCNK